MSGLVIPKRSLSGHKMGDKWRARITINGERKSLGLFNDPKDAALSYDFQAYVLNDGRPMNLIDKHNYSRMI